MNSLSLILRILAVVAAVAAGAIFFVSKGKLAEKQGQLEASQAATKATQAELDTANEEIQTLEGRLKNERDALADNKRKLEGVRSDLYTSQQEVSRTQQQLTEAKSTISDLEKTAKDLRSDLIKTEQELETSKGKEAEMEQLNDRVAELEESNADLKESLSRGTRPAAAAKTANGTLATGSGDYSSGFTPTASQPLPTTSIGPETTILNVSAKSGLLVLMNSPELGLTPGMKVSLVSDYEALGTVKFIQIKDDVAVANILPGSNTRSMDEGSKVILMSL